MSGTDRRRNEINAIICGLPVHEWIEFFNESHFMGDVIYVTQYPDGKSLLEQEWCLTIIFNTIKQSIYDHRKVEYGKQRNSVHSKG